MTGTETASSQPMVSVVLVNWNRATDILDNIRWLKNQTWSNLEIIVVDNGSRDESLKELRKVDGIRLIELAENFGPARARNEGIRRAAGEFILLLDSDSYLGRTGLAKLVARMQTDLSLGILGCRVMNWYSGDIDQWFYPQNYETLGDTEFETYSFSGAGALLRTTAVKQAGGFWDDLFIYNEEVDLSIGIIRAGYRILYVPDVPVFHRSSKTGRVPTARFFYYQIRNWIWILYRHYPFWQRSVRVGLLSAVYVIKGMRAGYLKSCLRGILDGLRGTQWIGQFNPKLTTEQIRKLSMLNRRWRVRVEGRT